MAAIEPRQHRFAENGARIRSARRKTGLSQEIFAGEIGTTRRHVIRLENGEHLPSGSLRDRIVEKTGESRTAIQSSDDEEEALLSSLNLDELLRLRVRQIMREEAARQDEVAA